MDTIGAINLKTIVTYMSYWIAFWTVVNFALPPREVFKDFPSFLKWYNVILNLVGYYGSLNIRQFTVKLYSAVSNGTPPPVAVVKTTTEVIPVSENAIASKAVSTTPVTKMEDK